MNLNITPITQEVPYFLNENLNLKKTHPLFSLEDRVEKAINNFLFQNQLEYNSNSDLNQIILKGLKYNLDLKWSPLDNLDIIRTPLEFLKVMKLRSNVFRDTFIGYDLTFFEDIKGLSYDKYDSNSPIFIYKNSNSEILGTIRFVLESEFPFPSESYIDRKKFGFNSNLAEMSRQAIRSDARGNSVTFKSFYANAYLLAKQLNITHYIARIDVPHFKLYEKLGGVRIEKEIEKSENVLKPSLIISWEVSKASDFFKRGFLQKLH